MFDPLFLIPFIPVLLLALTLHEFGHAWTAVHFGDPTPKLAGRLTLDPLKHLDPLGTLCLFIAHIGWAKPVPVNPANFTHRYADLWVSLAGIIANLVQAIIYAAVWHVLRNAFPSALGMLLTRFLWLGIMINLGLALFNLLPIFPLDGSHVLRNLLPRYQAYRFGVFNERYGSMILLSLFLIGYMTKVSPLGILIGVPSNWIAGLLLGGI